MGGDQHPLHAYRPRSFICHRYLGLTVGPQVVEQALHPHLGEALGKAMGKLDGRRHQLVGIPVGVPEHHPLVTRPELIQLVRGALPGLQSLVDTAGDVGTLAPEEHLDRNLVGVEADVIVRVADVGDGRPNHAEEVSSPQGSAVGGLPSHDHLPGGDHGLAGHPSLHGIRVLLKDGIEYGI